MFKGSIPALVTPMRPDGALDLEAWDRLLDFHLAEGSDALVVGGTTGESPTLARAELEALITAAKRRVAGRVPVIAGSGTAGTAKSVELSRAAEAAGADALLVVTPYYNRPTQEGLFRHYTAIADAVGIPLVLYNVPGRTACDLLPDTVARLSAHPRIVGVKEATGSVERCSGILAAARPGFVVLSGDDATAIRLVRAGALGVISVTANVAPRAMHEACAAALAGDFATAERIDATLAPLHERLFVEPNPIPVKWLVHRMGIIGETLRLPLVPLSAARRAEVEAAALGAGLRLR
jgi:4-hydroxy-tetrahydrodipicolinate synthase